jgi:hypothetical protein
LFPDLIIRLPSRRSETLRKGHDWARVARLGRTEQRRRPDPRAALGANFGLQAPHGKRVAIISDARLGGRADQQAIAERLLSITGEDAVTIDRKYRDARTDRLQTRFLILSNELPRLADASGALASRFIVLTLSESFYGREDLHLTDRLLAELLRQIREALGCDERRRFGRRHPSRPSPRGGPR